MQYTIPLEFQHKKWKELHRRTTRNSRTFFISDLGSQDSPVSKSEIQLESFRSTIWNQTIKGKLNAQWILNIYWGLTLSHLYAFPITYKRGACWLYWRERENKENTLSNNTNILQLPVSLTGPNFQFEVSSFTSWHHWPADMTSFPGRQASSPWFCSPASIPFASEFNYCEQVLPLRLTQWVQLCIDDVEFTALSTGFTPFVSSAVSISGLSTPINVITCDWISLCYRSESRRVDVKPSEISWIFWEEIFTLRHSGTYKS